MKVCAYIKDQKRHNDILYNFFRVIWPGAQRFVHLLNFPHVDRISTICWSIYVRLLQRPIDFSETNKKSR